MKNQFYFLLILIILSGCEKSPKIDDLKEFCRYTVDCYIRNDAKSEIDLHMTKKETIRMLENVSLPEAMKRDRIVKVKDAEKEGYFSQKKLIERFNEVRSKEDESFWREVKIEGFENMETNKWFGYQMAKPILILKYGDNTFKFKAGELIKSDNGWRIIEGSSWE